MRRATINESSRSKTRKIVGKAAKHPSYRMRSPAESQAPPSPWACLNFAYDNVAEITTFEGASLRLEAQP